MSVAYCSCGHAAQIHTPTGRMDDTPERCVGPCTASRCDCDGFAERR